MRYSHKFTETRLNNPVLNCIFFYLNEEFICHAVEFIEHCTSTMDKPSTINGPKDHSPTFWALLKTPPVLYRTKN